MKMRQKLKPNYSDFYKSISQNFYDIEHVLIEIGIKSLSG
ncbi:hypothetical protein DSOL_4686 [Desulfosporosinus metallidurans]|uniref:Uncharacterized protein n=1 Tax=Desulfosporosinus metallidurans TaxID=1888891 RepID=A0A1Q8QIM4_9FIRM|nr:hypothetical protein DSOL_4686 [Desulfosporosinus metallidurans]